MRVTRIIHSINLNKKKYLELEKQARLLGNLRKEVWQHFGSINGVGKTFREIRNDWVKTRDFLPLPNKAWKETLRDVLDDIHLYEAAVKLKVKKDIFKKIKGDNGEQKRLFTALKKGKWVNDPYLSRRMRKYKKHGKTKVNNQIILDSSVYSQFIGKKGNTWLKIPSFQRGQRVCIPLNSNIKLKGSLRLILKAGVVYVHYTITQKEFKPCGDLIVGVDKGYTEAFVDSEGKFYGQEFGCLLTQYTNKVNERGKARNKLYSVLDKLIHKKEKLEKLSKSTNSINDIKKISKKIKHIKQFNLGKKKLLQYNKKQKEQIRNIAFQSVHKIVDSAKEIRAEDLTRPIATKNKKWKQYNRKMSAWAKGSLAEALNTVTKARGSCLRLENCAYTSQMDSNTNLLQGKRVGDKFYHENGDRSHADINAARNIKQRSNDTDITRYMPFRDVKKVLLDRLKANGGVSVGVMG